MRQRPNGLPGRDPFLHGDGGGAAQWSLRWCCGRRSSDRRGAILHGDVALARVADLLTAVRLVIAPLLVVVGGVSLETAGLLLAGAWVSDALDGRAARASGRSTRLGRLDLTIDTVVGAGLLLGMANAGVVPVAVAVALVVVLGGAFLRLRNPALALVLQGVAYGWFLVTVWTRQLPVRWVLLGTIAVLFLVGARRLFTVVIPAFLSGVVALVTGDRGREHRLS